MPSTRRCHDIVLRNQRNVRLFSSPYTPCRKSGTTGVDGYDARETGGVAVVPAAKTNDFSADRGRPANSPHLQQCDQPAPFITKINWRHCALCDFTLDGTCTTAHGSQQNPSCMGPQEPHDAARTTRRTFDAADSRRRRRVVRHPQDDVRQTPSGRGAPRAHAARTMPFNNRGNGSGLKRRLSGNSPGLALASSTTMRPSGVMRRSIDA